jgi:hypothetical protein
MPLISRAAPGVGVGVGRLGVWDLQGYLDHEKPPHPRTLQQAYAEGPTVVLGGGGVL